MTIRVQSAGVGQEPGATGRRLLRSAAGPLRCPQPAPWRRGRTCSGEGFPSGHGVESRWEVCAPLRRKSEIIPKKKKEEKEFPRKY